MKCFFTIDVEDWFQVENLKDVIQGQWDDKEFRAEANTYRLLDLLEKHDTKATFFVLGWIAEKCPQLIRDIASQGHEVASHGYGHELVYTQSPEEFQADIRKSKALLEELAGKEIIGYRAPSFSITDWATDVLVEEGFKYDSSYFEFGGNRYGKLDLSQAEKDPEADIYKLPNGLYEFPATTLKLFGKVLPWSGGGYFRLLPYLVFRWGYQKAIKQNGSGMFYIHPWEIDAEQPRVKGLNKYVFRHYVGLKNNLTHIYKLIEEIQFGKIEVF
jgi:polysaccharide deacetylase family protein (PEP-CTERM system associated)